MSHITDLYFSEEISKILGCPCKVEWLRSVSNIEYRLRQRRHIPQQKNVVSSTRVWLSNQPAVLEACTPVISRQSRVDSHSLKENDIDQVPISLSFLKSTRSTSFEHPCYRKIGLIYTDAAHSVLGDAEVEAFNRTFAGILEPAA